MITPSQYKVYKFICQYIDKEGYSPSYQEVARGIGISPRSKSLISRQVHALMKAGYLEATKTGYRYLGLKKQYNFMLPFLGRIAAGVPIEVVPDNQVIDVGAIFRDDGLFVLQVKGDSMREEGILDGDYVVCKQVEKAAEGDLVIALIDEEAATLKRLSYKPKGKITLIPANTELEPTSYVPSRIHIQGVFIGLLRIKKLNQH